MKHLVVFACIFLFFSSSIVADEPFSVGSELTKPGVKLVVLEFYATYCMPCRKAVPQWDMLHKKYRSKGLRFVVVTIDEEGGCTNPGWSPDRVICDKDRYWQKRYGVEKLPQAFLYTWQGELISERTHVEQVEQAIVRFFTDTQLRMTVDQPEVLGDKCAIGSNPEWVRDYVVGQLGRGSKFDVVDDAAKALPKMTEGGQCSVSFPPNSNLRIRLSGDCEGNRTLTLTLEKDGCVLAGSQQPYKGKGFKEDQDSLKWAAREAVKEVLEAVTKVKMPAAMVLGKPGGEDWFEEMKVVVLNFSPQPIGMVLVDGKAACPQTPCSKSYPPGSHEITISAENYLTRTETLALSADRTIDWKLTPDFGLLNISSEPPGLVVTIDRQEAGETPLASRRLAPRSHLVEIGNACYYKEQQTVTLDRGDEKTIAFTPKPIEGGLTLTVKDDRGNVIRAEASIDGQSIGQAPGRFKVSVCAKELVVSAAGYGEYKEKVAIVEKKLTSIDVVLKGTGIGLKVAGAGGIELIRIEPGSFMMGSPAGEDGRDSDETQHRVTITKPYLLAKTELTQGQWQAVMGSNPSYFTKCGVDCPVEQVSFYDAIEFLNKLSDKEGLSRCYSGSGENIGWLGACTGYRLPTEAEWEYAVRAGSTTALYTGPLTIKGERNGPELDAIAWYGGNSGVSYVGGYDCSGWTEKQNSSSHCGIHPVGRKLANAWGLHDMLGNVWEWVWDWKAEYPTGNVTNSLGPVSGSYRVGRGGGWGIYARDCRSAFRDVGDPGGRGDFLGFRPARSVGH